ncbi:TIGR00370 family protein [Jonquetella anthropi DSM 22815]|uniref:TIGR00370 family protein n=1 Tax=Jonquetella anthropi DSM 22815 TaxID=885272 RepID=H0UJ35_9BACT|nr:5-oxoprolinase subunit PxpB [Jonquetella anthropi]EHM13862.1 TIGR00370 family protein [Jonquetella anthropi DSM 22815]
MRLWGVTRLVSVLPAGEGCLFLDFGNVIDMEVNGRVHAVKLALERRPFVGLVELVPSYRSLAVYFDPIATDVPALREALARLASETAALPAEGGTVLRLPVCYGGDYGPDMGNVTSHTGLSEADVVARHTGRDLYCYMLGFLPGFAYLGGMDESLATPRLTTPRKRIEPGSVGIAGRQTGAYSVASPGGWQIIGRTPVRLYDPDRSPAAAIQAGFWVRYYAVTAEEYGRIARQVQAGAYQLELGKRGSGE